jgi:hypothetical protein
MTLQYKQYNQYSSTYNAYQTPSSASGSPRPPGSPGSPGRPGQLQRFQVRLFEGLGMSKQPGSQQSTVHFDCLSIPLRC